MNGIHQRDVGKVFLEKREVDIIEMTAAEDDAVPVGGVGGRALCVQSNEGFAGIQVGLPCGSAAGSAMANGDLRGQEPTTARSPSRGSDRPFENF